MISSIFRAASAEFHQSPIDWYLFGAVFALGIILVGVGIWLQNKQTIAHEDKFKELEAKIPSILINGIPVAGPAAQVSPSLRSRTIALRDELQAFLQEHGPEPKFKRELTETDTEYLRRVMATRDPWREKLGADFRLKLKAKVAHLRDEFLSGGAMGELGLNDAIDRAGSYIATPESIEEIRKHLWTVAGTMEP
jgi:hypothetical protein